MLWQIGRPGKSATKQCYTWKACQGQPSNIHPDIVKDNCEIHKLIAAACNIKLSKYYEGKKKVNTTPDFKNISGASEGQMNRHEYE